MSEPLSAPTTLRMPTSRARFSLRAVLRFIKLIQAMSRINAAISENILMVTIRPHDTFPFWSNSEYKRHFADGCRKTSISFMLECDRVIFTTLLLACSSVTPGLSNAHVCTELFPQPWSSPPIFLRYDHGIRYSKLNSVLFGRSFKTPVTVK